MLHSLPSCLFASFSALFLCALGSVYRPGSQNNLVALFVEAFPWAFTFDWICRLLQVGQVCESVCMHVCSVCGAVFLSKVDRQRKCCFITSVSKIFRYITNGLPLLLFHWSNISKQALCSHSWMICWWLYFALFSIIVKLLLMKSIQYS